MRLLLREAQSRRALGLVENSKDALEEDVAEDVEANAGVGLDAAEALRARDRRKVHVAARDRENLATDRDVEVGECGAAAEDVTTLCAVVGGAGNLLVVGGHDGRGQVEERGAGVGNRVTDAAGRGITGADGVATSGELPEAVGGVDWNVGDGAGVLRAIDVTLR